MIISFVKGKAEQISFGGNSLGSASICGSPIKQNDTMAQVEAACGSPSFVNKTNQQVSTNQQIKISTWTYQFTPYQPQVTLTFHNQILKSVSQ